MLYQLSYVRARPILGEKRGDRRSAAPRSDILLLTVC